MAPKSRFVADLKKAQRRRLRRVKTGYQPPVEPKIKRGPEQRIIARYQNVLYAIESLFAGTYHVDARVDDELVGVVLKAAIRDSQPDEPAACDLLSHLQDVRHRFPDLPQATWIDCMRVVYTSLCRHSSQRDGDVSYLQFASIYVR